MRRRYHEKYRKNNAPASGFDRLSTRKKNTMAEMKLMGHKVTEISEALNLPYCNVALWLRRGGKGHVYITTVYEAPNEEIAALLLDYATT